MARMNQRDRRLVLQEEEAALDHGSVERIAGNRAASVKSVREAIEEVLTSREEEAALDQGSVGRVVGRRETPPPSGEE